MKTLLPIFLIVLLTSCAQQVWYKPNAYQGEFEQVKYACLQQSQQFSSGSKVAPNSILGGYVATSSSGMSTNNQLFVSCMNAKGFNLQDVQQLQRNQANEKNQQDKFYPPPPNSNIALVTKYSKDTTTFEPNSNWSTLNLCSYASRRDVDTKPAIDELKRRGETCR